jgi:predicted enzyme related to lactoylglutathione lyase
MPINAKYVHTNLTARDWRRLVDFYRDVFGCIPKPPARDISGDWIDRLTGLKNARLRGMHLSLPGFEKEAPTLEIFTYDEMKVGLMPVANEPGYGHLAFAVDDVAAAQKAVIAGGGSAVGEVLTTTVAGVGKLWVAYVRDPEGNIIELQRWN